MYEEDQEPLTLNVTLSEIYHQAASHQQPVELAQERSRVSEQFLPFENYTKDSEIANVCDARSVFDECLERRVLQNV